MSPGKMHSIVAFDPPLPVETPDGSGLAYFMRDYGHDHDDWWTVVPTRGPRVGQFRTYRNSDVRAVSNETVGRGAERSLATIAVAPAAARRPKHSKRKAAEPKPASPGLPNVPSAATTKKHK